MDPSIDEKLADFVVDSHIAAHPNRAGELEAREQQAATDDAVIAQEMLKKYITYAKQNVHPKLTEADTERIVQVKPRRRQARPATRVTGAGSAGE